MASSVLTSSFGTDSSFAAIFGFGTGLVGMGLAAGGLLQLAADDEIDAIDPIGAAVAMGPIARAGGGPCGGQGGSGGGAGWKDLSR